MNKIPQKIKKIKKVLSILVLVLFVSALTAESVMAYTAQRDNVHGGCNVKMSGNEAYLKYKSADGKKAFNNGLFARSDKYYYGLGLANIEWVTIKVSTPAYLKYYKTKGKNTVTIHYGYQTYSVK